MWKVALYKNTGLNSVNILDNPAKLATSENINLPTLDILQGEFLSYIRVKATRNDVKNVDYCVLKDTETGEEFYYTVESFQASSVDVQTLYVTMDALMTLEKMANGIDKIKFTDGMVERHHVKKEDDVYGAFTEPDPYLVPSKELEMDQRYVFPTSSQNQKVIIESTISLDTQADNYEAVSYVGEDNLKVTVPTVTPVTENTTVHAFGSSYTTPGTEYFDYSFEKVQKGVSSVRALGVEGGILNSYSIPENMCRYVPTDPEGRIIGIWGVGYTAEPVDTALQFEYANVNNKRVLYGSLNSVNIISIANGTRMSFKPEDLKNLTTDETIKIGIETDPRPHGRPYFFPEYYKGSSGGITSGVAVPGMTWANAPLVYTGASGSTLNEIQYDMTTSERVSNFAQANFENSMSALQGMTTALAGAPEMEETYTGNYNLRSRKGRISHFALMAKNEAIMESNVSSLASYGANAAMGLANTAVNYVMTKEDLERQYSLESRRELNNFLIGQEVVAPNVHFPMSETTRDFIGNGATVLRYRPASSDLAKMDKILTMYGYKDTKTIDESDFVGRAKFNYVMATGVTITGNYPKWLREAAASQISAGVRVWHQLPDISAYTDGTNV